MIKRYAFGDHTLELQGSPLKAGFRGTARDIDPRGNYGSPWYGILRNLSQMPEAPSQNYLRGLVNQMKVTDEIDLAKVEG